RPSYPPLVSTWLSSSAANGARLRSRWARSGFCATKEAHMQGATPVVLVHGFWHGSWCWSLVSEELASRGVAAVAVDLDGHGLKGRTPRSRWRGPFDPDAFAAEPSPVAGITASSAAASLVEQVRRIGGGRPCPVAAHSMGGTVATAAAEQAPEPFAELMYVAA